MKLVVPRRWMKQTLRMAALYNIVWGVTIIVFPYWFFDFFALKHPTYTPIWQGLGMIVGVFGIGYFAAATKPYIHWPIILVGFLGKILGTLGFLYFYSSGTLPSAFGSIILINDLLWLIPFAIILVGAFEYAQANRELMAYSLHEKRLRSLSTIIVNTGENLQDLSDTNPVLLIFLRHFGCTFCREALAEIAKQRTEIEANGTQIVLVHMVDEDVAENHLKKYPLTDIAHISDPDRTVYNAFGLNTGSFLQLFGLPVILRGLKAGVADGHSIGGFVGNGFQMPGVFLISKGMIVQSFTHTTAADRPDYVELSKACELDY